MKGAIRSPKWMDNCRRICPQPRIRPVHFFMTSIVDKYNIFSNAIIMDWYSRKIVDYELSTTLEKTFVMNGLKRALARAKPEIINSDQGSHFTNPDYLELLDSAAVKVSMDGKGQALDNVRTERFFRTLKYDLIYTHEFETPRQLRKAIGDYMKEYNTYRPHSSIDDLCPDDVYYGRALLSAAYPEN